MKRLLKVFLLLLFCSCQKEMLQDEEYSTLGTAAKELLSAAPFSSLIVEVNYMPGFEPDGTTMRGLSEFLNTYLNKPAGIIIRLNPIKSAGKEVITLSDLVRLERAHRTAYTYGDIITAHILITDTKYTDDDVFATSYWNTSFCLFGKTIAENSGGPGQASQQQLLSTLMQHEFGHLLGLVNQGSPMQQPHRDNDNGAHCINRSCLMYYSVETGGNSIAMPSLDAQCKADLKANGGK